MTNSGSQEDRSPTRLIDARIEELGDWRGEMLSRLRAVIKEADPDIVEEWKWRGVPVWSHDGIVCTGETYKKVVKMTFAKGASLEDPAGLFNSSLDGNMRRAIDFHEGENARRGGVEGARPPSGGPERVQGQEDRSSPRRRPVAPAGRCQIGPRAAAEPGLTGSRRQATLGPSIDEEAPLGRMVVDRDRAVVNGDQPRRSVPLGRGDPPERHGNGW